MDVPSFCQRIRESLGPQLCFFRQRTLVGAFDVAVEGCKCPKCTVERGLVAPVLVLSSLDPLTELVDSAWMPEAKARI